MVSSYKKSNPLTVLMGDRLTAVASFFALIVFLVIDPIISHNYPAHMLKLSSAHAAMMHGIPQRICFD